MDKKSLGWQIGLLLGVLLLLTGARLLWSDAFYTQERVNAQQGQLDLRGWSSDDHQILLLEGEWEFYPSVFLLGEESSGQIDTPPVMLQVPGSWTEAIDKEGLSSNGYGSYRLRIYTDPEQKLSFSLRVPSVRTSSELYVNGRLLANSGKVATTPEGYTPRNVPYSATFTADEDGIIDIVLQAANFEDLRGGGIKRAIKFGLERSIERQTMLSISMQLLGAVVILMNAVYAAILYLIGTKERRLLFFGLLALCITTSSMLSTDDKPLHQFITISYTWDYRLSNVGLVFGLYALLACTEHRTLPYWRRIAPIFSVLLLCSGILTLLLKPDQIADISLLYGLLSGVVLVVAGIALFKQVAQGMKNNLLLILAITVLVHHGVWLIIWREDNRHIIHYPFDLLIAIGCLAALWFRHYFKMFTNARELAATLQRVNDRKDHFLANTSHEFKNPLHGMLNLSQAVLQRERHVLHERSIRELETVHTVGRRLTMLLNDLIDVMSLREGKPRLQIGAVSISPVVTGVLELLRPNIEAKPVRIVNEIPEDYPRVLADENRLVQIVFNLLHNAVKFTNEGLIVVRVYTRNNMAHIAVKDTGVGMERDMLNRLFRPYEQANAHAERAEGGFGLGLSICKQLIELQGGKLMVESTVDEGSTFTFSLKLAVPGYIDTRFETLPLDVVAAAVEHDEQSSGDIQLAATDHESDQDRLCLLIADDDPVNLRVLETMLPPDAYMLKMVTSGKEALSALDSREWDLVISDIMMPQMSGYELTRIIRERFTLTELPILLITARNQAEDIQNSFLAGANDYIAKPFEPIELKSRIAALTTIKRTVKEQLQLEAAWLRAQIQPHFLFNALNSVTALSEIDLNKMRDLLDRFGTFLRNKFQFQSKDGLVSLEDELELVHSYLYIEKVRFDDRLKIVWDLRKEGEIRLPYLAVQSLVENAIKHGLMKRPTGGRLTIRAIPADNYVEISVEDDGVGMDEQQIRYFLDRTGPASGVGLINTDQRLKRYFGTGLQIESVPGQGTKVCFRVQRPTNAMPR